MDVRLDANRSSNAPAPVLAGDTADGDLTPGEAMPDEAGAVTPE